MRSSLAEVDAVSDVATDCSARECSFTVNLDEVDITTQLNELAKENKKMEDWSLVSMQITEAAVETDSSENATDDPAEGEAVEESADSDVDA